MIDLRPGSDQARAESRRQLVTSLDAHPILAVRADNGLAAALAGASPAAAPSPWAARMAAVRTDLERARQAHKNRNCPLTMAATAAAIATLAELHALAKPDSDREQSAVAALTEGYVLRLECARAAGHADAAMTASYQLQRVRNGRDKDNPPPGIDDQTWQQYQPLDATANAHLYELTITTEPSGGTVWFDHQIVGSAPVTVVTGAGLHLAAAKIGQAAVGRRISVGPELPSTVVLAVSETAPTQSQRWSEQAAQVDRWRRREAPLEGRSLGALMSSLAVRFAVVLSAPGPGGGADAPAPARVTIWSLATSATRASRLGFATIDRVDAIAAAIVGPGAGASAADSATRDRTGPDPAVPLLRESDVPESRRGPGKTRETAWWVYATIIGAITVSSMLILVNELGEDRQRIELRWP